jgi:tetratricopeptide (TPR) repeat protein
MGTRGAAGAARQWERAALPNGAPAPFPEPAAMTETLFERYKEALRAGHVAVVRGRLEEGAVAYRDAISIAPDRAVPRTALGSVHLRLGDPQAALEAYDAALEIAPDDDPATLGRAQALVVLRRTAEAAVAYDHLADLRSTGGRIPQAAEAARRALAIEPTDERRARHAALVEQLRATSGPAVAEGAELESGDPAGGGIAAPVGVGREDGGAQPDAGPPIPPEPDPDKLIEAVEEATVRGDAASAAAAALAAARAYRDQGHVAAAFDACLQGIGARPSDVDLHLLLAELAAGRGWNGQAGDTYANLLRLVELDGDTALDAAIRAAAAEHLPGDPRFAPR